MLMWFFPWKGDGMFEATRKIIFLGALGCFIYFGGSVVFDISNDLFQQRKIDIKMDTWFSGNTEIPDDVYHRIRAEKPDILEDYIVWYNENSDMVGHILLPDLSSPLSFDERGKYPINYFVVQARNNTYYLNRAWDHSHSKGGSIFADSRNRFTDGQLSGNTVLYGHNIRTENYFSKLANYYRTRDTLSFYKNHPIVFFNSLYEKMEWKIFAVVLFNTQEHFGEVYRYNIAEFDNKDHFNSFILDIMDRSVLFTDVDITYGDHILTLSTCHYPFTERVDSRVAIFARRVREGEDIFVDVDKATYNSKEYRWKEQRRRVGTHWNENVREWDTSYLLSYDGD